MWLLRHDDLLHIVSFPKTYPRSMLGERVNDMRFAGTGLRSTLANQTLFFHARQLGTNSVVSQSKVKGQFSNRPIVRAQQGKEADPGSRFSCPRVGFGSRQRLEPAG